MIRSGALAAWVAVPVIAAELALGVRARYDAARVATLGAVSLLLIYAAAISVNDPQPPRHRLRLLGAAAPVAERLARPAQSVSPPQLASLAATSPRVLGAMDLLTIALGVGVLYALYTAANLLLAYAPRTRALLG
jgi:hypothetical protein